MIEPAPNGCRSTSRPEGAVDPSHGWSAAKPVVGDRTDQLPAPEGRLYSIGYSDNLILSGFNGVAGATNLPYTQNSYTDTVERTSQQNFYHVEVRLNP